MTVHLDVGDLARRYEQLGRMPETWTNPQRALFESPYRVTVYRGGNGLGKSMALARLVEMGIAGELPWQRGRRGPFTVMLAGNTWKQIGQTVEYLMLGRMRGWLKGKIRFEAGAMKGQRMPTFDIVAGKGKGGKLILAVFDAENIAGPRADVVVSDEPLPEKVYNELWPRLNGRGGRIYMGFTTTLGTAGKLDYLWDLVDDPTKPWIGELAFELNLDNVTPRGGLVELPFMSAEEIRQFEEGVSKLEADMRMGRTRYPRQGQCYFDPFGPHCITDDLPPLGTPLGVGIDHGSRPGRQQARLVAVGGRSVDAEVWVLEEYQGDGSTGPDEDALGILAMLERRGLKVADVEVWVGDRATTRDKYGSMKSNDLLKEAIARALGFDTRRTGWWRKLPRGLQRLQTPVKYDGSVWEQLPILRNLMHARRCRFHVAPHCVLTEEAIYGWQGNVKDPLKDGLDALRYPVIPMMEGTVR